MQRDPWEADQGEIQDFSAADDNMEGKKVDLLFLLVCFMTVIFNFFKLIVYSSLWLSPKERHKSD